MIAFDVYPFRKFAHRFFCNLAVDLRQVGTRVFKFRVQQFLDQLAIVRQQERPLTIVIQAPGRIHPRREPECIESRMARFRRKLA